MTAPRLFAAAGPELEPHHHQFGDLPHPSVHSLVAALDRAGLTGRGGAGFPTGRKVAALAGRGAIVIGNGAEGEPLSAKDATLLSRAPHLVLDGLGVAAEAVAANAGILYVPARLRPIVTSALEQRAAAKLDRRPITVVDAPDTFVAGEESAVIRRIEGGPALPRDRTVRAAVSGVRGRPTLVSNVETFAHIALITRFGPEWFGSVGDPAQPGTMLTSLSGALARCGVAEVPTGTLLTDVIGGPGQTDHGALRAVLVGGYHGRWTSADALAGERLSRIGAGIVHGLGRDECGLVRTAAIAAYLAEQSARQCGPCHNGLPRLAMLLDQLAYGHVDDALIDVVHRTLGLVDGRGSCRHPDGAVRMVRSALRVFESDIDRHRSGGCEAVLSAACGEAPRTGVAP